METLASRIARDGALRATDAVGWVVRLTRSLERAHARGSVHGRVSPHCVRIAGDRREAAGEILGRERAPERVAYHSPERALGGEMSVVDDTWAVAVTLYEALCGRLPFRGATDAETRAKITAGKPAPLATFGIVDPGLQAIIDRALNLDWFDRTIDVAALRRDLEAWQPDAGFASLQPLDDAPEGAAVTTPLPARSAPVSSRPDLRSPASRGDEADEDPGEDDVLTVSRRVIIEDDDDGPSMASRSAGDRGRDGDGPEPSSRTHGLRAEGPASSVAGLRWGSKSPPAKARGAGAPAPDSSPGGPLGPKSSPLAEGRGGALRDSAREDDDAYDEYDADSHPTRRAALLERDSQPTLPVAESPEEVRRMLASLGLKEGSGDGGARGGAARGDADTHKKYDAHSHPTRRMAVPQRDSQPTLPVAESPEEVRRMLASLGLKEDMGDTRDARPSTEPARTPEPPFGRVLEVAPAVTRPHASAAARAEAPAPPIAAPTTTSGATSGTTPRPSAVAPGARSGETQAEAAPPSAPSTRRRSGYASAALLAVVIALVVAGGGLFAQRRGMLSALPGRQMQSAPPSPTLAATSATPPAAPTAAPGMEPTPTAALSAPAEPANSASASPPANAAAPGSPPDEVNACVRPLFADDTFAPGTALDFAYLCQEADPRRGGALMKSRVVAGSAGRVTDGMREWALLGWYQMAAFAVIRARCCPGAPKLTLPSANSPCDPLEGHLEALAAAAGAARDVNDIGLRDTLTEFTKAIRCHVKTGGTGPFEWKDSPQGGADTALLKTLARIAASH